MSFLNYLLHSLPAAGLKIIRGFKNCILFLKLIQIFNIFIRNHIVFRFLIVIFVVTEDGDKDEKIYIRPLPAA